ncbi:MAG: membrane dipeptidase [Gemmatimonadetes bacterium]|nr:membrane dipeptidase [Gemmatimonadota bacterium]
MDAKALYRDALVWDMVFIYEPEMGNGANLFDRYRAAGVNFVSVHPAGDRHNVGDAIKRLARCRTDIKAHPNAVLVESVDDILAARAAGKLAVGIHLEGFRCLERDLNLIETYYQLGVRFVHPIFNLISEIGGGCADRYDIGLTKLGVRMVAEMNRVGMLVDGAHAGYRATLDMMEVSTDPVIFSHLACYGVHPHMRNVRDDQIRTCADKGGVIGITGGGFYLGAVTPERYFQHLDYVAQMVGHEHVGVGLDYLDNVAPLAAFIEARPDEWPGKEQGAWEPMAFFPPDRLGDVTELMLKHGYTDAQVRGILGENWLRICRQVWK